MAQKNKAKFNDVITRVSKEGYIVLSEYAGGLEPINVLHLACGYKYTTKAVALINGNGCPKCGHLKTGQSTMMPHDIFEKEFKKTLGDEYELLDKYTGIEKKILVLHKECGEIYRTTPKQILSEGSLCPYCKTKAISNGERRIEQYLSTRSIEFSKQYKIKECKNVKMLKFDFAILSNGKLFALVEFDGRQHYEPVKFYGGEETYNMVKQRDKIKSEYCKRNNVPLIRVPYYEFKNIESYLDEKLSQVPYSLQLSLFR